MQREMPLLSIAPAPARAPDYLVGAPRGLLQAVRVCINTSGLSDEAVCSHLGIDKGHFSRMLHGRANLPLDKLGDLMRLTGSLLPLQVLAHEMGCEVFADAKAQRRAELQAELALLDEAVA